MNESAIKHLDVALFLVKEQRKAINAIKQSTTKKVGFYAIALSAEEKAERIRKTQNQYKRLIDDACKHLNTELEADGREPLTNLII